MPIDRRLENSWEKEFEQGLPDARTRGRKLIQRGRMWFEAVYCVNCGDLKGLVTPEWTPHICFVCDPCHRKLNGLAPPGMVEGPPPPTFVLENDRLVQKE